MFRKIKRKHKYANEHDESSFGNTGHNQTLDNGIKQDNLISKRQNHFKSEKSYQHYMNNMEEDSPIKPQLAQVTKRRQFKGLAMDSLNNQINNLPQISTQPQKLSSFRICKTDMDNVDIKYRDKRMEEYVHFRM